MTCIFGGGHLKLDSNCDVNQPFIFAHISLIKSFKTHFHHLAMTDLPDAYFEMRSFVKIVKRYDDLSSFKYFLNIYILWLATNNICFV